MRIILALMSLGVLIAAVGILLAAQSAIHEIESFILFLIFSVLLSAASIIECLNYNAKRYFKQNTIDAKDLDTKFEILMREVKNQATQPAKPDQDYAKAYTGDLRFGENTHADSFVAPDVPPSKALVAVNSQNDETRPTELILEARELIRGGAKKQAVAILNRIITEFPGSRGADKANQMLGRKK